MVVTGAPRKRFVSVRRHVGSNPTLSATFTRRDDRVAEGARLESVCAGNRTVGSNPTLSASGSLPSNVRSVGENNEPDDGS